MQTPSFKEDHISQIPALQMLIKLGYKYISPDEALKERNGTSNVLLENILRVQLPKFNSIKYGNEFYDFSSSNIELAIRDLKTIQFNNGYIEACKKTYNLLMLGKSVVQSINGDKKSYDIKFIDWENLNNNVFHVTEEFNVKRMGSNDHYRPDLVLFINGIPVSVIECKRPDIKDPIKQAISQQLRNQQDNGIRNLFVYSQLLLVTSVNDVKYGTNATTEEFWSYWKEKFQSKSDEELFNTYLYEIKNKLLAESEKNELFAERYRYVKNYFDLLEKEPLTPTEQDKYLYCLCRPERILDFIQNFIAFELNVKKIARYPQYFAVKKIMERIKTFKNGARQGGVVWHTQGSGKSLTMVWLAQAIASDKSILNPKIILVTDRVDLDAQIKGNFKKCGKNVINATTGKELVSLIESASDAVITTIINKFETGLKQAKKTFTSSDIFVLVDEGHRTQYGEFNIEMMKALPNACFIAFTGTPLLKKEKNTASKFGGIIDAYTVDMAVDDKAVVPLLYEGRLAFQNVNESAIDNHFLKISEPLNDYQKADLKKKFSNKNQLNIADNKVYEIARDISYHFRDTWQGTGFKGQLVCQSKAAAVLYKKYLDEISLVTSEVLISPPDDREGENTAYKQMDEPIKAFWKQMMDQHGNPKTYESTIINNFKGESAPDIIIVVDKLLTGFDAPRNIVLYITRNLQDHTLLQAIARVNRVFPGKEFGYIIDYYGVIAALDTALEQYSLLNGYDYDDLTGAVTFVDDEIKKLPQKHSELWDIFKTIKNKYDEPAYEEHLRDEAIRTMFYQKLSAYSHALKLALSTLKFRKEADEKEIERYKIDLAFFQKIRYSVSRRFSDVVDYSKYEKQIQTLIDKHITTEKIEPITELVNIFDKEKFLQEVEKVVGTAARADTIASRTAKHISENMEDDPAFYKKFSQMLKDAIKEFVEQRISEVEYLRRVTSIMENTLTHTDKDIPAKLADKDVAKAFYGLVVEYYTDQLENISNNKEIVVDAALEIDKIIESLIFENGILIVDWQMKSDIIKKINQKIFDYLVDEISEKYGLKTDYNEIDEVTEKCIDVAKRRYK